MLNTFPKRTTIGSNYQGGYAAVGACISSMSMEQQQISLRIAAALLQYTRGGKLGRVFQAPCGVILSKRLIQPDVVFVARERRGIIGKARLHAAPDLIVDLMPPGMQQKDLQARKKLYAFFEVKEYWITDPVAFTIEVLVWSEMGYIPIGKYGKMDRVSSPLLPDLNLALSGVFITDEDEPP